MTVAPSGNQFELAHGAYRAVVVEVGGGIRCLTHDGRDLIEGYRLDAVCDAAHGQLLIPWPNRIEDATYPFAGTDHRLAVTEPATGSAIHGLTRWVNWSAVTTEGDRVTLTHRLHPQPGWDGVLDMRVTYRLDEHGLAVTIDAHNVGSTAVPFGAGAHPYLSAGRGSLDEWDLTLAAGEYVETDNRGLPVSRNGVAGTPFDFRDGRRIGKTRLDTPFTGLDRGLDGRCRVTVGSPDDSGVVLWADESFSWFQVFTGDHLGDPTRRRTAIAVEPMTCPPNAFRTGEDLIVLAPGDRRRLCWGIGVRDS